MAPKLEQYGAILGSHKQKYATDIARTRLPVTALDTERLDSWTEVSVDGATKRHIFTHPGFSKPVLRLFDAAL